MPPSLNLPGPLRIIGKKHVEIATQWLGSAAVFGATTAVGTLYFTDWRVICEYIPFYNGKFKKEE